MTTEKALALAYRLLKGLGEAENLYRDYQAQEGFTDDEYDEVLTKLELVREELSFLNVCRKKNRRATSTSTHQLILATLPDATAVILDGVTIYHEEQVKGHYQKFTAQNVAERLSEVLECNLQVFHFHWEDLDNDIAWDFDDLERAALQRAAK